VTLSLGVAAFGAPAQAQLAFEQALHLAQDRSRQLAAQDAAASAARDMAVAAGQLPDPTLTAGINNLPINGPDQFSVGRDFMTMRSIGVTQEFTRAAKREARAARFDREAEAAEAARALALSNLQRDTAVAWLDRYYQERMREVLVIQRDEAKLLIEAADAAYRGDRGSQTDVFAARSSVAQIEDRIAQTEGQVASAKTQLARWVGDAATGPLADPPETDTVRFNPADLETRLEHHPQIAVMVKQEKMAEADADLARANERPDWSVQLMYSQRGSAYPNLVSLNVSVPVPWDRARRQDRELAAKLALIEQMRAEREDASRAHVAEALAMLQQWQSNRDRLSRYDASLLPLAAERKQAALAAYNGASGTLSAVLDARRNEIDTRIDRLLLAMQTARLWAQLNYLVPVDHDLATHRQ
jgi:outer membrane protein TolC